MTQTEQSDTAERRRELVLYLQSTMRHLIKHDVLWNSGMFEGWRGASEREDPKWDNDTVVEALQVMVVDYIQSHWHMTFKPYPAHWGVKEDSLHAIFPDGEWPITTQGDDDARGA